MFAFVLDCGLFKVILWSFYWIVDAQQNLLIKRKKEIIEKIANHT